MLSKRAAKLVGEKVWYYAVDSREGFVRISFYCIKIAGVLIKNEKEFFVDAGDFSNTVEAAHTFSSYKDALRYVVKDSDKC